VAVLADAPGEYDPVAAAEFDKVGPEKVTHGGRIDIQRQFGLSMTILCSGLEVPYVGA
jgi:hypothetical protein